MMSFYGADVLFLPLLNYFYINWVKNKLFNLRTISNCARDFNESDEDFNDSTVLKIFLKQKSKNRRGKSREYLIFSLRFYYHLNFKHLSRARLLRKL